MDSRRVILCAVPAAGTSHIGTPALSGCLFPGSCIRGKSRSISVVGPGRGHEGESFSKDTLPYLPTNRSRPFHQIWSALLRTYGDPKMNIFICSTSRLHESLRPRDHKTHCAITRRGMKCCLHRSPCMQRTKSLAYSLVTALPACLIVALASNRDVPRVRFFSICISNLRSYSRKPTLTLIAHARNICC